MRIVRRKSTKCLKSRERTEINSASRVDSDRLQEQEAAETTKFSCNKPVTNNLYSHQAEPLVVIRREGFSLLCRSD